MLNVLTYVNNWSAELLISASAVLSVSAEDFKRDTAYERICARLSSSFLVLVELLDDSETVSSSKVPSIS